MFLVDRWIVNDQLPEGPHPLTFSGVIDAEVGRSVDNDSLHGTR